ncbi:DASH complex subunit dad2 [Oleoguttula sp. CCFEE 5521]
MSFGPRPTGLPSHFRASAHGSSSSQNSQTSALQARIHEKKLELESLRQLRDLSAGLAGQMQQLEEKLSTLSDGTEAVAAVMGNWGNVLRAVGMASAGLPKAKVTDNEMALPQTLVRIPVQQAEAAQREIEKEEASGTGG